MSAGEFIAVLVLVAALALAGVFWALNRMP